MKSRATPLQAIAAWGTAVLFFIPLLWMLLGSLKPPGQPESDVWPTAFYVQNYADVIQTGNLGPLLINTIGLSCAAAVGGTASAALVAYGFAGLRWPGRDLLFFILIATLLLPFTVTMLPRFQLFAAFGLYNTYWPILLPHWLGQEAIYIFLLRQFLLTLPPNLADAARIDGAGEWNTFRKIVLPQIRPALFTVGLFQFLAMWNEFVGPLLYLNDASRFPLAYALEQFVSSYRTEYGPLMAGTVLFTLPALLLFLFAQRRFLEGIVTGGLKR